jgi:hypothetical protein
MTKRIILILMSIVLLSVALVLFTQVGNSLRRPPAAIHAHTSGLTSPQISFLQVCTGLLINNSNGSIAVANCLGRLRGLVDGHALTVQLASADPDASSGIELWCVAPSVSDKQLLDSVITWSTANNVRVKELVSEYTDPAAARTAVMIAALHASYPCEK